MLESVAGFFLFVTNWVSPVGDVGKLEITNSYNRNDSIFVSVEAKFRWQEVGTQIIDSGIPLRFNYVIEIDDNDQIKYHRKLYIAPGGKNYSVYNSKTKKIETFSNLFSALDVLKKSEIGTKKEVKKIELKIKVQNIKVKGIKDEIDLAPICGGGNYSKTITREMINETLK